MEELRQLFLSGGVSFGEIFAQLSGEGISGKSKEITTGKPATSTARLPIKHHFHWEDPPTDLIMKNKVGFAQLLKLQIFSWICNIYIPYLYWLTFFSIQVAEPVFAGSDKSLRPTDKENSFTTKLGLYNEYITTTRVYFLIFQFHKMHKHITPENN